MTFCFVVIVMICLLVLGSVVSAYLWKLERCLGGTRGTQAGLVSLYDFVVVEDAKSVALMCDSW